MSDENKTRMKHPDNQGILKELKEKYPESYSPEQNSNLVLENMLFQIIKQIHIYAKYFPKHEKYALAQDIINKSYYILDQVTKLRVNFYTKTTARDTIIAINQLKVKILLARDLEYLKTSNKTNRKAFLVLSKMLSDLEQGVRKNFGLF